MIRNACVEDIDKIMDIIDIAIDYMHNNGNKNQWKKGYPPKERIVEDIQTSNGYVLEEDGNIYGYFAFIIGEDPTYLKIRNGKWLNEELYGTIHRVASDGSRKGLFKEVLEYTKNRISNIRIDTHNDNGTMRYLLERNGFVECGIINVEDGSERIAYHWHNVI